MRSRLRTFLAIIVTMITWAALATPAFADSPQTMSCSHNWGPLDPVNGHVTVPSAAIHTGPHANCQVIDHVNPSQGLDFHCYIWNGSNTWTHVYVVGSNNPRINGWIWDEYLTGGGSNEQC